jgi:putative ABC transport system ATP-binding protein
MISARNLTKIYGEGESAVYALNNCNIDFTEGEFTAIVGTSGSGKSTLMHLLGGLDKASEGEVLYGDVNILSLSDYKMSEFRRRNIGFVFQFFNLVPELTAKENILLPLMIDKKKYKEDYFQELTEKLGISDRLSHYPAQLSGGQQQRVAIARALLAQPKVILCDEPTGNLDSRSGQEVLDIIIKLKEEMGQTIIMVTHDDKIAALADKVIRIEDGKTSK